MSAEAVAGNPLGGRDASPIVDFAALRAREPARHPFPYVIVPRFIRADAQSGIEEDFPHIQHRGSFPLASLQYGSRFADLIAALAGVEMTQIVEQKFNIDLRGRPITTTVRGISDMDDGNIHTDSKSKLITLLLYTNREWECRKGRLRLLRTPHLQDYVAEIPPEPGTLVIFRNTANAWHGFEPFIGQRRVIQVNWVANEKIARRETARHRLSAFAKRFFGG